MIRNPDVLFCGENPQIILTQNEVTTAAVSYWRCTYSPFSEGQALLVMLDGDNATRTKHPTHAIYADNALMARYVIDAFNRHFEHWQSESWLTVTPLQARFAVESDSRRYQRLTCYSDDVHIVAEWQDVATHELRTFRDINNGGMGVKGDEHFDVSTVICLCRGGRVEIYGVSLTGEITTLERDGRLMSSAFLAFSEVWTKTQSGE